MPLTTEQISARRSFAAGLTEFASQRSWYDARATTLKKQAQKGDMVVIGAGAIVATIPATGWMPWGGYLVSTLGVLIAIVQGAQRVFRSADIWPAYRQAAETMKREERMYIYGTGAYGGSYDEACARFLINMEGIMAREQQEYFENPNDEGESKPPSGSKPSK